MHTNVVDNDLMAVIERNISVLVSDGSAEAGSMPSLPLAAVFCLVIVLYGFAVLICLLVRQILLDRRPLESVRALHCCECLLLWPRPALGGCGWTWEWSPAPTSCCCCSPPTKTNAPPWSERLQVLWARVASVRCPTPSPGRCDVRCCRPQCPSSVLCCGLEIRRHDPSRAASGRGPTMVDAAVSGISVLDAYLRPQQPARCPPHGTRQQTKGGEASSPRSSPYCGGDAPRLALGINNEQDVVADATDSSSYVLEQTPLGLSEKQENRGLHGIPASCLAEESSPAQSASGDQTTPSRSSSTESYTYGGGGGLSPEKSRVHKVRYAASELSAPNTGDSSPLGEVRHSEETLPDGSVPPLLCSGTAVSSLFGGVTKHDVAHAKQGKSPTTTEDERCSLGTPLPHTSLHRAITSNTEASGGLQPLPSLE